MVDRQPVETRASRGIGRVVVAGIVCLLATLSTLSPGTTSASSNSATGDASSDTTPPPVTANEFLPEDRDLSDCISALPKPECGSEERGGWRQGLVLGLVILGMAAIAVRIVVAVRRRDRALAAQVDADGPTSPAEDGSVSRGR
jgi:hypothetical protein